MTNNQLSVNGKTFFLRFLGPPGTPYKQNEGKLKFHIWSVAYQNRVKRVIGAWSSFLKEFFENIKK